MKEKRVEKSKMKRETENVGLVPQSQIEQEKMITPMLIKIKRVKGKNANNDNR